MFPRRRRLIDSEGSAVIASAQSTETLNGAIACPHDGLNSVHATRIAHHLILSINAECLATTVAGQSAEVLDPVSARPDKGVNRTGGV